MAVKKCRRCGTILKNVHSNTKKCIPCRDHLKKYVETTMTPKQIEAARSLIGIKTRHQIAEQLGISLANLKRAFRGTRFPQLKEYPPDLVLKVCKYYEKHGIRKTEEKFPNVKPRSIIEKNYGKFQPRCIKWKESEIIELVRMAGLISYNAQAKYFNRPRANGPSIKSVWLKKFKHTSGRINGVPLNVAKHFVKKTCSATALKCLERRDGGEFTQDKKLILWVDAEKHLNPKAPPYFKKAVHSMADFQRWVFNSKNPKPLILKMIKERESNEK